VHANVDIIESQLDHAVQLHFWILYLPSSRAPQGDGTCQATWGHEHPVPGESMPPEAAVTLRLSRPECNEQVARSRPYNLTLPC
jgi:hypothetical protein